MWNNKSADINDIFVDMASHNLIKNVKHNMEFSSFCWSTQIKDPHSLKMTQPTENHYTA